MDITNFMQWFINEILSMFTNIYNILNNITFMGTSLLKVILTITILSIILPILLTLNRDIERVGGKIERHNEKVARKNKKEYDKAQR